MTALMTFKEQILPEVFILGAPVLCMRFMCRLFLVIGETSSVIRHLPLSERVEGLCEDMFGQLLLLYLCGVL